jgi:hypothetical protein
MVKAILSTIAFSFIGADLHALLPPSQFPGRPHASAELSVEQNGSLVITGNPDLSLKPVEGGWLILYKDSKEKPSQGSNGKTINETDLILHVTKEVQFESRIGEFSYFSLTQRRETIGTGGGNFLIFSNLGSAIEPKEQFKRIRELSLMVYTMRRETTITAGWYLDAHELSVMLFRASVSDKLKGILSLDEAQILSRYSAYLGNTDAMNGLGRTLSSGTPADKSEAVKWFLMAAERGDNDALGSLGFAYLRGQGVPADDIEAYAYFNLAAVRDASFKDELKMMERDLPQSARLAAQQRSKQIQKELEASREALVKQLFEAKKAADKKGA